MMATNTAPVEVDLMDDMDPAAQEARRKEEEARIAAEIAQAKVLNDEHKIWKKNTPLLYDVIMTHALAWPTLTCSWLPDIVRSPDTNYEENRLLLGTHTSGQEPNHLLIASLRMPKTTVDDTQESEEGGDENNKNTNGPSGGPKFDADRGEYGGYGCSAARITTMQKIIHKNEVHKASYMPQNPCLIATKGPHPEVLIFDYTKHPSEPPADGICRPDVVLNGHDTEGYELSWNKHRTGHIVSASDDGKICLWDITHSCKEKTKINALRTYSDHTDVCENVQWHNHSEHVFGSVGDDKHMILWDARTDNPSFKLQAHEAPINTLAWHPFSEYVVATGSADTTVALWDMRKLKVKLHSFEGHTDEVFQLQWSPFHENVLASGSLDRRTMVWDMARIGEEQTPEAAVEGPPELMFVHGGHLGKLTDFAWNEHVPWTAASVAYDNMIQIWQISKDIYDPQPSAGILNL